MTNINNGDHHSWYLFKSKENGMNSIIKIRRNIVNIALFHNLSVDKQYLNRILQEQFENSKNCLSSKHYTFWIYSWSNIQIQMCYQNHTNNHWLTGAFIFCLLEVILNIVVLSLAINILVEGEPPVHHFRQMNYFVSWFRVLRSGN